MQVYALTRTHKMVIHVQGYRFCHRFLTQSSLCVLNTFKYVAGRDIINVINTTLLCNFKKIKTRIFFVDNCKYIYIYKIQF